MEKITYSDNLIIQKFRDIISDTILYVGLTQEQFISLKEKTINGVQYLSGFVWIYNPESVEITEEIKNNLYGINR